MSLINNFTKNTLSALCIFGAACGGAEPSAPQLTTTAAASVEAPQPALAAAESTIPITVTKIVSNEVPAAAATPPSTSPNVSPPPTVPTAASAPSLQKRVLTLKEAVAIVQASKGSVVFFHLYASWCGPCRHEFPDLVALGRRYGAQGLKIVAVSLDEEAADLDKFLLNYAPLSFDTLRMHNTSDAEFSAALRPIDARFEGGIPYTAIYDRQGKKVTEWTGSRNLSAFEQIIKPLL